jgi:hypothetical protein
MKNGKGVTWLDDLRIPFAGADDLETWDYNRRGGTERTPDIDVGTTMSDVGGNPEHKWGYKKQENIPSLTESESPLGRFAANLLVQDDVLCVPSKGAQAPTTGKEPSNSKPNNTHGNYQGHRKALQVRGDEGSFSRYFDMDAWWEDRKQKLPTNIQTTYPFMIVPKASKGEKNKGLDNMDKKVANSNYGKGGFSRPKEGEDREIAPTANFHPTVKPISLMSYLVIMGSRENDLVLDPFVGSGTTCIAAKLLNRKYLGMELNDEYAVIAQERIKAHKPEKQEHDFF